MKQFKSISTLLLVLLTMAMFATSCKKDDNEGEHDGRLVGTWVGESYDETSAYGYGVETLTFKAKGTGTYTFVDDKDNVSITFDWKTTNQTIIFTFSGSSKTTTNSYSVSEDGQVLTLHNEYDDEIYFYKQ